jgi:hypothetical protein
MARPWHLAAGLCGLAVIGFLSWQTLGEVIQKGVNDANLLRNPKFDNGEFTPDHWWTFQNKGGAHFYWVQNDSTHLSPYAKIDNTDPSTALENGACWGQTLIVKGKLHDYRVSAKYSCQLSTVGIDGGVALEVDCWNENYTYLGGIDTARITTSEGWTMTGGSFALYSGTYLINVCVTIKNAIGEVLFDDVSFVAIY